YCIPAAGQNDGENTANLIGHCVNFLPLRSCLDRSDSFPAFLKQNRDTFLAATDHRSYTYGELIRDLKLNRDPRRMPLSEIAFNVERMDYFGEWDRLEVDFQPNPKTNVHYTLFLNIVESDQGLRLDFDFNGDVLDQSTVERWAREFEQLIETIADGAMKQVGSLSLLPQEESDLILNKWSGAAKCSNDSSSITEHFANAVSNHPDKIAVQSEDTTLTYQQLDSASTRAAVVLQSSGVTRGDRVGLIAARSPELIISLLGILKAGGAYVPIDPDYPAERINLMLEDSGAKRVISDRRDLDFTCATIHPDDFTRVDDQSFEPVSVSSEDIAYVIYTSGSTGRPKGTLIPHRGVVRLVRDTDYIAFGDEQTFLLSSPVTFDASTLELWGSLLNGGRLALLPAGTPSLAELGAAIARFEVSTLWLTSGLFQLMVDERLDDLSPLKQLLVGGDVVSRSHAALAIETLAPEGRLFNGYGPTENTTFTTVHPITLEDTKRTSIPIGKPIPGTTVYILDDQLNPVPTGVKGRLYFGGAGLSPGYLNRKALTAQAFIENPFDLDATLYDSGDHGRWLANGSIEFLGRADEQVKVRGFRIETGEIETVLTAHPDVRNAAIVVTGDSAESKQLSAFLLPEAETEIDSDAVLHHAKERLPAYMIPNRVLVRREFPLTANGKVDYRTLKTEASKSGQANLSRPAAEPNTETEQAVAEFWADILSIESVSRHDDFFNLGGHSLAGLRLFTR
ncbi:MAG: amino acid adenylation domain-containing protein, partial [Verrucomicrobiota bacterium]